MAKKKGSRQKRAPLPSKQDIIDYIRSNPDAHGKREIARAFRIRGQDKVYLKRLLREMEDEGLIERDRLPKAGSRESLPSVTVIEVSGIDLDGELLARPAKYDEGALPPRILLNPDPKRKDAFGIGDRVLARLTRIEPGVYEADAIKRLPKAPLEVLGVFAEVEGKGRITPISKGATKEYLVEERDRHGAKPGELVLGRVLSGRAPLGLKPAAITERLGSLKKPRSLSLIAIHDHDIPHRFPDAALEEAKACGPASLGNRTDLRDVPLITIDPVDARDHDDAVWAERWRGEDGTKGWHVIVAIADVAHYVRVGTAMDTEAHKRGNSVYFPDQVVPMLPEALSADLCSLREGEDRAALAVHMWFDSGGRKVRHRFERALVRSAGFLHYRQAQAAIDGAPDDAAQPLLEPVLKPLFGAWRAIMKARAERGPLDLDVPEKRVLLDDEGNIALIEEPERLDAHRVIEEMMIEANVCAAESLEQSHMPCMYRVHEPPGEEKLEILRNFLADMDINLIKTSKPRPQHFNQVLKQAEGTPYWETINEAILRSQAQARYSIENAGHFGLALARYAHFTSPIRRYADLVVHRALIRGLKLGKGGLRDDHIGHMEETAEHISICERRAIAAERDTVDRYIANFLADKVGAEFPGRISGATRFGLFVRLDETGADGLIPMSALKDDFYVFDEQLHALIGRNTGLKLALGDAVRVRLREADAITGGVRFDLIDSDSETVDPKRYRKGPGKSRKGKQGKSKPRKGKPKRKRR